jgi:hypothetical protein
MSSKQVKISRIAFIAVFLALIRLISECFRLDYLAKEPVTFRTLEPYLVGALVCAVSCLAMTIFSFYAKPKVIIAIAILTITTLVVLKIKYTL